METDPTIISTEDFLGKPKAQSGIVSTEDFFGKPLLSGSVQQVVGEIPTKQYFKNMGKGAIKGATLQDLTQSEEETPGMQFGERIGGILPMIASEAVIPASPLVTPLVKAGLAGTVYGAARGAVNRTPPLQNAANIAGSSLSFMAGQKAGKLAGKVLSPFKEATTPEIIAQKQAAESVGINPLLGTLTENKGLQGLERKLEYTPFGQAITLQRQKALGNFYDYIESVAKKIAVDRPSEVQGNLVKEALNNFSQKSDEIINKMYDDVMPLIRQANPEVVLENTKNKMQDILKNRSGEFESSGLNEIRNSLKNMLGKKPIESFEQLKIARTNLGQKIKNAFGDPSITGIADDLKGLYGAMTEDMNQTVKKVSDNAFNDLQAASDAFKNGQMLIKDSLFKQIAKAKPENVYKLVIVPGSPSQAEIGKELLGDNFKDVARQWFDDIVKQSSPQGVISPQKFLTKMNQYETVIPKIIEDNPSLLDQFNKLQQISKLLSRGKEVQQGSQTAYLNQSFLPTLTAFITGLGDYLFGGRPIETGLAALGGASAVLGGQKAGVKMVTSDLGKKYLTTGLFSPTVEKNVSRSIQVPISLGLQEMQRRSLANIMNGGQ